MPLPPPLPPGVLPHLATHRTPRHSYIHPACLARRGGKQYILHTTAGPPCLDQPQRASTCNATPARMAAGKPTGKDARQRHAPRKPLPHPSGPSLGSQTCYAVRRRQPPAARPHSPTAWDSCPPPLCVRVCVCVSPPAGDHPPEEGAKTEEKNETRRDETKRRLKNAPTPTVLKEEEITPPPGLTLHLDHLDLCIFVSILSSRYPPPLAQTPAAAAPSNSLLVDPIS